VVYGFDPLIENKVANDDRFVRYNRKIDNFAERVDRLVRKGFNPPSVIKIDVEGEELEVLKGAEQTIIKYRPARDNN
jgi:FkbM family methyltransferase